ncbi:hypothetical protein HU230_0012555 [Bradyrhizobium quebecense]|uniref:Uncharacterized protein n=1 Tax=Bradyrhizobium quebecense TaxID=2748629 RepID=A0A973WMN4_9BRAD|nr:hypothetical protein [Bradyrhizobium quebecense]UGA46820.1 hypothetical protein HU230_0012555 [Bradyrhizobium quebecense]
MACKAHKDQHGTTFIIPEAKPGKTPGGRVLPGSAEVVAWWAQDFKGRLNETLIIKQENSPDKSDVIELTLAQAYDLHHALGCAILAP